MNANVRGLQVVGKTDIAMVDEDMLLPVLQSSLYPGASIESIRMVLGYCKAAGLDPMQKPVHIVPIWDGKAKRMRDVVMPGINLYRIQASRSNQFAGITEPEFGEEVTETLGGAQITYPRWCKVTVKRALGGGAIAEFTALEYWKENYAVKGGPDKSIAPNAMWTKRPRGQIVKCAEAQALRKAFPEFASMPTADEMEGKQLHPEDAAESQAPQNACPPELLDKAKAAASKGLGAYETFFKEAGKEGRTLLAPHHVALKAAAIATDERRTVDAETGEIDDDFVREMRAGEHADI